MSGLDIMADSPGNGTVGFSVAANPDGTPRSGTLTVAGQTLTVNQQAAPCKYALDHDSQSFPAAGGAGTLQITATPGCAWTATSDVAWITGVTLGSGTGNGTVNFSVAANPDGTPRTGTLTVAGQMFTVTQQGAPCMYSLDHASQSFPANGGAGMPIMVTSTSGCTWTATVNPNGMPWITLVGSGSGPGNGTVNFNVAANPSVTPRMGTLTVAGQTFTVTQQGTACMYSLDHASESLPAAGGTGMPIMVTAAPGCFWTATVHPNGVPWISIVGPGSGTGNGTVSFSVEANPNGTPRTGTLTIAGHTFTVTQHAAACMHSLDHAAQSFPAAGGAGRPIIVTATPGCAWTATVNPNGVPWITIVDPASGTGNGTLNFSVAANPGATRTGTLTIAGHAFTVTQAGH